MIPLPPFLKRSQDISLGSQGLRRHSIRNEASNTCVEVP